MIVLDTNVVSELMRPQPAPAVIRWAEQHAIESLFTTTITQAEILYGLALLPAGRRRATLREAVDAMFDQDLAGRLLPFDSAAAGAFAAIAALRRQAGRPIAQFDAQIAAICHSHGAALATRNSGDFADCGLRLINPWQF